MAFVVDFKGQLVDHKSISQINVVETGACFPDRIYMDWNIVVEKPTSSAATLKYMKCS